MSIFCGLMLSEKIAKLVMSMHMLGVYDSVYMYLYLYIFIYIYI